jgi:DNA recombination protein RmuC
MMELLLALCAVLLLAGVVLLALLLRRGGADFSPLQLRLEGLERGQERTERALKDELGRHREEATAAARAQREELAGALKGQNDSTLKTLDTLGAAQRTQLERFSEQLVRLIETAARQAETLRAAVESQLTRLQADNAAKLEEMRRTVDEKLQGTLERRLGESFKLVSERLELVHKGLGEMQTLASGVGDLKKVLTNVKTRGTWGEMQLGSLLEQILTPEQYAQNVATRAGSGERVEFALKLPGRDVQDGQPVWLPIDAKFPKEDYERLVAAADAADPAAVEQAARQLEARLRLEARNIREKYLDPPHTTDFGILYLPTEGLYAEALRRPGLVEALQRDCRVNLAGPTTLAALLNSLQMGFRTLAIEKRSSEVWAVLGAVKTEFGKFGEVIDKVQKKLNEASSAIDAAGTRTRVIERRLREVQELPAADAATLLRDEGGPAAPGELRLEPDAPETRP